MKVCSPVTGYIDTIDTCSDQVFASKALGDGFVIIPYDSQIVSPIDGKVSMIFPTKHAIGIIDESGNEVLLHIGIDTVGLDGVPFDLRVSMGEILKKGDVLLEVNFPFIRDKGLSTEVIVLFSKTKNIKLLQTGEIKKKDFVLEIR